MCLKPGADVFAHLRVCTAHIVNLVVGTALKVIDSPLQTARKMVKAITYTTTLSELYKATATTDDEYRVYCKEPWFEEVIGHNGTRDSFGCQDEMELDGSHVGQDAYNIGSNSDAY
jgi:hypothetical protein